MKDTNNTPDLIQPDGTTPGPWEVILHGEEGAYTYWVHEVHNSEHVVNAYTEPDALLAAAAPALYDVVKRIVEWDEEVCNETGNDTIPDLLFGRLNRALLAADGHYTNSPRRAAPAEQDAAMESMAAARIVTDVTHAASEGGAK